MCLISSWKCQSIFQAFRVVFSRMKEAVAFIATASKGIGCCCCRCFFCRRKQVLQSLKAPWQGFRNIQANQYKYSNRWGLGARRLATYTSHLHQSTNWIAKSESEGWHPTQNIHSWIPLPVFTLRTFVWKLVVKLCTWFGAENAKAFFKHLE